MYRACESSWYLAECRENSCVEIKCNCGLRRPDIGQFSAAGVAVRSYAVRRVWNRFYPGNL
jgi:hypothetical protein